MNAEVVVRPKVCMGNLFAAAAAVQTVIGALLCAGKEDGHSVVVNCFGPGNEQAAFRMGAI